MRNLKGSLAVCAIMIAMFSVLLVVQLEDWPEWSQVTIQLWKWTTPIQGGEQVHRILWHTTYYHIFVLLFCIAAGNAGAVQIWRSLRE